MRLDALVIEAWLDIQMLKDHLSQGKKTFLSLLLAFEHEAPIVLHFITLIQLSSLISFLLLYLEYTLMMKFYDYVLDCKQWSAFYQPMLGAFNLP